MTEVNEGKQHENAFRVISQARVNFRPNQLEWPILQFDRSTLSRGLDCDQRAIKGEYLLSTLCY